MAMAVLIKLRIEILTMMITHVSLVTDGSFGGTVIHHSTRGDVLVNIHAILSRNGSDKSITG